MEASADRGRDQGTDDTTSGVVADSDHQPDGPTALSTRERQRLDTHRRIYAAAEAAIRRDGLAGLSVAAVAKAAGVSRQTFYDHFPTLDTIVEEALGHYQARVIAHLDIEALATAPLDEVLHRVVGALFSAMGPRRDRLRLEMSAHLARGVPAASWLDEPLVQVVVAAVERAQHDHQLTRRHDPTDTTWIVLTALSGFLNIENEPPPQRAARAHDAVDILVAGLRTDALRHRQGAP